MPRMTDAQRDAIILADALRHIEREGSNPSSRAGIAHGSTDRAYMSGMGLMPQSETKRRYPHATPRLAYTDTVKCEGTMPNVLVHYVDGLIDPAHRDTEIRTASSFRKQRTKSHQRTSIAPEYKPSLISRLEAIGNID